MITGAQGFAMVKAIAECAWNRIPNILAEIPVAATAGKVVGEVKNLCEDVKSACNSKEENDSTFKNELNQIISKYGGEKEFRKKLRRELKAERDIKNPKYINAAIFSLDDEVHDLSESERHKLEDTLKGNMDAETPELSRFVSAFSQDYFANDYEACDNPVEIGNRYIAFNFDDMSDHPYDEEDLKLIMEMLNKIIERNAFCEYEGLGTDDSVDYAL